MTPFDRLGAYASVLLRSLLLVGLTICTHALRGQSRHNYDMPLPVVRQEDGELEYRGQTLHSFIINPYTGALQPSPADTVSYLYHNQIKAEGRSIVMAYLGNLRSPWLDMDYFHRQGGVGTYPFARVLSGFSSNEQNRLWYNTKTPYAKLFYQRNGPTQQREEECDFTLAANRNRHFGFGGDFHYVVSPGYYIGNRTKGVNYRLFGSVTFDQYEAYLSAGIDETKITENGGIKEDIYISNPTEVAQGGRDIGSREIPVRFAERVWNGVNTRHLFLSHRYNFGEQQQRPEQDSLNIWGEARSLEDSTHFVSVASIGHILHFHSGRHEYVNQQQSSWGQYPNQHHYIHRTQEGGLAPSASFIPFDSTYTWQLDNSFVLSLREGFRPWVQFGLDGYIRLENRYYYQADSLLESQTDWHTMNAVVGGRIARTSGDLLNFDVLLETTFLGEDIGSLLARGAVSSHLQLAGFPVEVRGWGRFENRRPHYYQRHYHGSFHWWDIEFGYERQLSFGGALSFPSLGTELTAQTGTLQNHIYFTHEGLPEQHGSALQILSVGLRHGYRWHFIGWRADALYQASSQPQVIPLPTLSLYGALYTDFFYAKVLRIQLGVDCRWHTRYYAPYYEPAIMQFVNQHNTTYGNFPLLNAFASFQLKRTRFFVEYYNLGDLFIKSSPGRFSAAHYPLNPPVLRLGLALDLNK